MAAYSQTASSVATGTGAVLKNGTAGAAITAGMPVYLDTADNNYKPARADEVESAEVAGIAVCNAATNQPFTFQTSGRINMGTTFASAGLVIYLSPDESGKIVPVADINGAGEVTTILGVTASTTLMDLAIYASGMST